MRARYIYLICVPFLVLFNACFARTFADCFCSHLQMSHYGLWCRCITLQNDGAYIEN